MMKGKRSINAKAVLLGFVVDTAVSFSGGCVSVMVYLLWLSHRGIPALELADHAGDIPIYISSLILGFGSTMLGGYVAGRVADQDRVFHGGLVGAAGIVLCIIFIAAQPLLFTVITCAGLVPSGMAGGFLAQRGCGKHLDAPGPGND